MQSFHQAVMYDRDGTPVRLSALFADVRVVAHSESATRCMTRHADDEQ